MSQKTYYKIIGKNYGNFPYREGVINSLDDTGEIFDPRPKCGPGGLYFCEIKDIFRWLKHGNKVCEITLPEDAQIVKVGNKFKADKIKIERIFDLDIIYLIEKGADIYADDDYAFFWIAENNNNSDFVKYLVKNGVNMSTYDNNALQYAAEKYLAEKGVNIRADDEFALRYFAERGHLDVVKYFVEKGANIHALDDWALCLAAENGHLDIVKFLVEKGANIHADDDRALRLAEGNDHLDVVKYLAEKGADIHINSDSNI